MRPCDYYAMVDGYNRKKRGEAERDRINAYFVLMPHMKEGMNYQSFCSTVWPMPWETVEKLEPIKVSDEEIRAIYERHGFKPKF